jgi:hypothetical protein
MASKKKINQETIRKYDGNGILPPLFCGLQETRIPVMMMGEMMVAGSTAGWTGQ